MTLIHTNKFAINNGFKCVHNFSDMTRLKAFLVCLLLMAFVRSNQATVDQGQILRKFSFLFTFYYIKKLI